MEINFFKDSHPSYRSGQSESNRRPIDLQSIALPTELCPGVTVWFFDDFVKGQRHHSQNPEKKKPLLFTADQSH